MIACRLVTPIEIRHGSSYMKDVASSIERKGLAAACLSRGERNTSMSRLRPIIGAAAVLALSACAVAPPSGPRVMALPAPNKDFPTFQREDATCRQFASDQIGGAAGARDATDRAVGTGLAGAALGAGAGAALGSLSGHMGAGAAVGGVLGALVGGSAAASGAQGSANDLQQRYDTAYTQCMYAYGNTVQSPPGGYRAGGPGPYPYGGPAVVGAPAVVIGGGWGWGHGYWRR